MPTKENFTQYALDGPITSEAILDFYALFKEDKLKPVEIAKEPEVKETPQKDKKKQVFPKAKSPFVQVSIIFSLILTKFSGSQTRGI